MNKQFPNEDWNLSDSEGHVGTWERVSIAVLMDIRRELRTLNQLLHCPHFQAIPRKLEQIARNTTKKRKRA